MKTTDYSIHRDTNGLFVAKGYSRTGDISAVECRVTADGVDALAAYKALVAQETNR
jgi:hypothetical protein